ncbi:MAG: ASPIC/UnbV domain-containing protein [Acidobacteriaceae bacterium]
MGDATSIDNVDIHWPSGAKETLKLPGVDRIYTVTEGKGFISAMCGGKACPVETSTR